jgi:CheY-like chemotaxis protein
MNGTVLIVDEDVVTRAAVEALLRGKGLQVRSAANGLDACDILDRGGADMVVLELPLPGMNGWELIRKLQGRFESIPSPVKPRIVVVTNRSEPETEHFVRSLGADAFFRKPLPPVRFLQVVERLLAA